MVRTRSTSAFQQQFPLFHAIIAGDVQAVTALCAAGEAAKCGPGNLSALMLVLLLDRDEHVPQLLAAGAPLEATLTHSCRDAPLHKWLTAAQLSDMPLRWDLCKGRSALGLAILLGKDQQAAALIAAGAGLQPLVDEFVDAATINLREWLMHYAYNHYSERALSSAPAALLGSLALLALQLRQPHACLEVLQAASKRSVHLQDGDALAILRHAAVSGGAYVTIVMHVVQHSPASVWRLQPFPDSVCPDVAAVLFPYLAQQFREGKLKLPYLACLRRFVLWALRANQPAAALAILHAVELKDSQQQQLPQPQPLPQPKPLGMLSASDLGDLLEVAAPLGHPAVVMQLLHLGAPVWRLLEAIPAAAEFGDYYDDHPGVAGRIHPAVAAVLFPHLVQLYNERRFELNSQGQLSLLLVCIILCNQPGPCCTLLLLSAARQQVLNEAEASNVLQTAAERQQPAVVMQLAEQYGPELLWLVLDPNGDSGWTVVHEVLQHQQRQLAAGALQLDSTRLGLLMCSAAQHSESAASMAILQAAAKQHIQLTEQDAFNALSYCVTRPCPMEFPKLLLALGPQLSSAHGSMLARWAAECDHAALLELLLEAGALVDADVVISAVKGLSLPCLNIILKHGHMAVDLSNVFSTWDSFYTCPVLRLLQISSFLPEGDMRAIVMLERLLAAGYAPTIYRRVILPPFRLPLVVFDPLKQRPREFPRTGASRWLHLAIKPEGWSPATHRQHPRLIRRSFRTVLRIAAHGRLGQRVQIKEEPGSDSSTNKRQHLEASASGACEALTSVNAAAAGLGKLPNEVLLHVLHMAARPLSAWLAV